MRSVIAFTSTFPHITHTTPTHFVNFPFTFLGHSSKRCCCHRKPQWSNAVVQPELLVNWQECNMSLINGFWVTCWGVKSAVRQLHVTGTRRPSANRSFWWRHTVPKHTESPPRRHFIQRQKQITACLQTHLWVAGDCNASIISGHCWEVCWLARITVWAKSGGRSDPCAEWWVQWPDLSSVTVTNVRMRTVGQMRQQTRLHGGGARGGVKLPVNRGEGRQLGCLY